MKRMFRKCLVAVGVVAWAASPATADDLCGATIIANLELDHDLSCAGNGLIVGADGITLDLSAHTITGSGVGFGISVTGRTGVSIVGGTVRNFVAGVRVMNSTAIVVRDNQFVGNMEGVDLATGGAANTIKVISSTPAGPTQLVIMLNSRAGTRRFQSGAFMEVMPAPRPARSML